MEVTCEQCGKKFNKSPSKIAASIHHFCSNTCKIESRTKRVKTTCDCCGKEFEKKRDEYKKSINHFCSKECVHKFQNHKKEVVCMNCGVLFLVSPSLSNGRLYCSDKCKYEHAKTRETKNRKIITCDCCGKEFVRFNYRLDKNIKNYCSYECMGKAKEKKVDITCQHCQNVFKVKQSTYELFNTRFCSMKCRDEYYKYDKNGVPWETNRICQECGKSFITERYRVRAGFGKFCSKKCMEKNRTVQYSEEDKHFYSSATWRKLKKACQEQYDYTCQICGVRDKSIHIHHMIPRMWGGPDDINNLIALCNSCHIKTEAIIQKALKRENGGQ